MLTLRSAQRAAGAGGARRGGGVGAALPVDAVVRGREDFVDLAEHSDGLVEVQAERGEVVDRGGCCSVVPAGHLQRVLGRSGRARDHAAGATSKRLGRRRG